MKINKTLRAIAIVWAVISVLAIMVRLPFGEDSSFINIQWYNYMILSAINLGFAIWLYKAGSKIVNVSTAVIVITFVITEIMARKVHPESASISGSIASAVIPIALIAFLQIYKNKK